MIDLRNTCILVRTKEENKKLLKEAEKQGFHWYSKDDCKPLPEQHFPDILKFYNGKDVVHSAHIGAECDAFHEASKLLGTKEMTAREFIEFLKLVAEKLKEVKRMTEVLDIKDAGDTEFKKLDITPELAIAAYNTLIQFCKQQEGMILCSGCILHNSCPAITDRAPAPEEWEEIHYPRMTSNTTIEYLKDGRVQLITYGRSEDAEKAFKEMAAK